MLKAYCDESYAGSPELTPAYVFAGFIGSPEQWAYFETLWRETMKDLGIEKIGFHARLCAPGAPPYDKMKGEERAEIQNRLMVDIKASRLFGVVAVIDMEGYREYRDDFSNALHPPDRQYNVAHALSVKQCAQQMCLETEAETTEVIEFVVDQNRQFGKRAKAWYDHSRLNPDPRNRHAKRYGELVEGNHRVDLGLQAADLLAYSAMRDAIGKQGWQWREMLSARMIGRPFVSDREFWAKVAELAREPMGLAS
jgi:hypothetical protein